MGKRPKAWGPPIDGILVVDKPYRMGSTEVVTKVRRAAQGCRTGHAGTLDPLATGVLVCCLGKGTKSVETIMGMPKEYETTIDLSAWSETDDLEGPLEPLPDLQAPTLEQVAAACQAHVGAIEQTPSAYSALKINGKPAYELARAGKKVEMKSRTVQIYAIEVVRYDWPHLTLRIRCGRGTYIRSLARQIGEALGTGGYLTQLRRTAVGPYRCEQGCDPTDLPEPLQQEHLQPIPVVATTGREES